MKAKKNFDAVDLHNEQAELFKERYLTYGQDPFETVFTYGRWKVGQIFTKCLKEYPPPQRVLDLGCGTGFVIKRLSERGYHCTGVDAADEMLRIARRENPNSIIRKSDAGRLPFKNGSFDIISSIELLRYIKDREKCVQEMHRVLKPGGICMVTLAPRYSLHGYSAFNWINYWLHLPRFSNVRQYFETTSSSRRLFSAAGFKKVEIKSCFFGPFVLAEKILPRSLMRRILRSYEPLDNFLGRHRMISNFANHMIVIARK